MSRQFSIISAGPGQPGMLTERARDAVVQAEEAYACGRVAGALALLRADWKLCPAENLPNLRLAIQSDKGKNCNCRQWRCRIFRRSDADGRDFTAARYSAGLSGNEQRTVFMRTLGREL